MIRLNYESGNELKILCVGQWLAVCFLAIGEDITWFEWRKQNNLEISSYENNFSRLSLGRPVSAVGMCVRSFVPSVLLQCLRLSSAYYLTVLWYPWEFPDPCGGEQWWFYPGHLLFPHLQRHLSRNWIILQGNWKSSLHSASWFLFPIEWCCIVLQMRQPFNNAEDSSCRTWEDSSLLVSFFFKAL